MDGSAYPKPGDSQPQPRDHLFAALAYVLRQHGCQFTRRGLLEGLPVKGGLLSPELLPRAAQRAGFKAELLDRKLSKISGLVTPFIVLLKDGSACVVTRIDADRGRVSVVHPHDRDFGDDLSISQLQALAGGHVFFLAPFEAALDKARTRHWLWYPIRRFWPSWSQIALAAFVINLLGLAVPLFVMNVYDRVIPNAAISTLWALTFGVLIALGFDLILRQVRTWVLEVTGRRVDMGVAAGLFEHAMAISLDERHAGAGALASQIREFETVRDFFTSSSFVALIDLLFTGIFIYVLWLIVGPLAIVPAVAVPVVIIITVLVQVPLKSLVDKAHGLLARRHGVLVEALHALETVKAVGGQGALQRSFENAIAASARVNSASRFWSALSMHSTMLVQQAVSVIIIVWGVYLIGEGLITIGALVASNILAGRVLAPLGNLAQTIVRAQHALSAYRGLNKFMGRAREDGGKVNSGHKVTSGTVRLTGVSFSYPQTQQPALSNINLNVAAGERIGIVGRVGSGKSTLGRLLAGFHVPTEGTVQIDGVDNRQFDLASLRAGVGYLPQEPDIFMGTVKDNIIMGRPDADPAVIEAACVQSGLEPLIASHPDGLNMVVGERGRGLSGGQKQAVALARLLVRETPIIFLDEPASALDSVSEADLIERLAAIAQSGRTVLLSTHRFSMLKLVDRLVVLDGGKIIADGPRDDVIAALQNGGKR